ncbi:MAG: acyl carrier protein [Myxococcaceae bacterium]|nr:acyl carrier protein [Myxococcaceae bacterium]
MNAPANVDARVIHLISQLVPVKPQDIKPEQRLRDDLGMDSVSSMELLSMLAEDFELDVGVEDVADVHTVGQTIELVKVFLAKKAA